MDAISIGTSGMVSAAQRFESSAQDTVTGQGDPASNAVDQITSKFDFEASAQVVNTADQMLGRVLDMKA